MFQETIEKIGLNKNEAIIYEALVFSGESSLANIADKTHIHRRNAYDSLKSLIRRGLVFEIHDSPRLLYQAVEPVKLLELVQEKEMAVSRILPALQKAFHSQEAEDRVFIYRGLEGFKNNLRDVLRLGQPLYEIGTKGGWLDPRLQSFREQFLPQFNRKKIPHYCLCDQEAKNLLREEIKQVGFEYKFLPPEYGTNSAIHIFGDHVVTFTGLGIKKIQDNVSLFVMINQGLADSYRTWFKLLWELCKNE